MIFARQMDDNNNVIIIIIIWLASKHISVASPFWRLRQKDCEFQASLGYTISFKPA